MKRLIIRAISLAGLVGFAACEVDSPEINIMPDPIFETSGMQTVSTISIYDKVDTEVNITRTAGVSKKMEMTLTVDEALLEEYNTLYGTSYEMLGEQYYAIPETVGFEPQTKETAFTVAIRPQALVAAEGLDKANNKVLPVRISNTSIPTEDLGSQMTLLLHPEIIDPRVEVDVPREEPRLQFIASIEIPQSIELTAEANFTTLDVNELAYVPVESEVAAYNEANGTAYKYLEPRFYTIAKETFDAEAQLFSSTITFNGFDLVSAEGYEENDVFLLPLQLKSNSYNIVQRKMIYVAVELSELRVWLAKGGKTETSSTGEGQITVQMNSLLNDPQPINLMYEPSKVADYNTANGTSYVNLPEGIVPETFESLIPAGEQSGAVGYSINVASLEYDAGTFMAPLSIDRSKMIYEPTVDEERGTVYVLIKKTLKGEYDKEIWGKEKSDRVLVPKIFVAGEDNMRTSPQEAHQKYIINYNQRWSGGLIYFNISDETVEGYPTRRVLKDFCDRPYERYSSSLGVYLGQDQIVDSGSWFDTATETFYFNLRVLDGAYKNTEEDGKYGFGIEVYLSNRRDL